MHLSKDLQKELKLAGTSIALAKTIDGELPANYAFFQLETEGERNFRIQQGQHIEEISIILFDRAGDSAYEICYFRGLFKSLARIAQLLKNWIEKGEEIEKIASEFKELEVFEFDEFEHPNKEIEEKWRYTKNRIFNNPKFWNNRDYEERYYSMLKLAKRKESWKKYFPFTSHDLLRFSLNKELTYTWVLDLNIMPTWTTEKGKYRVGVPEMESKEGYFFEEVEAAIEFYGKKLNEYQPVKWNERN